MTTPLPHDHYDRKPRNHGKPKAVRPVGNLRTVQGFIAYDGKLADGRRLIFAAIMQAATFGLKLHSINLLENDDTDEASFRYLVEGDEIAISVLTEALAAL